MLTSVITAMIRFYQHWLGALKPPCCRFHPTCSEYTRLAVVAHGPARGVWLGLKRIGRCHPWGGYGCDPVPGAAAADGSRRSAGGAAGVPKS